jgi:LPLT family lysophospholipid transporter-like MFS transporter
MTRGFFYVIGAQTFSALADNALFIAAIALIQQLSGPDWMASIMKWWVAVGYVVLAAYVGAFADTYPKGRVMLWTNSLKVCGCVLMYFHSAFHLSGEGQIALVCAAFAIVGVGAAAYSPAKYGIITEMLAPEDLVKGNSWIEGMTVLSIILGAVLGGLLVSPTVASWLLLQPAIGAVATTPAEAAIVVIAFLYAIAAWLNFRIPDTGVRYPRQSNNLMTLNRVFFRYVSVLWRDKLGQISLAVTTLFWGAGATLQLVVIEWGRVQLNYRLDQASILMGVAALGTIFGAIAASKVTIQRSLSVLPVGVGMGLVVLAMPLVQSTLSVYALLLLIGGLSGYFVVPMNALLQHRGHVLLSAGHSIAVQNFNEQLNILAMVSLYTVMLWLEIPINVIIVAFGVMVAALMTLIIRWNNVNHKQNPALHQQIGDSGHGRSL